MNRIAITIGHANTHRYLHRQVYYSEEVSSGASLLEIINIDTNNDNRNS